MHKAIQLGPHLATARVTSALILGALLLGACDRRPEPERRQASASTVAVPKIPAPPLPPPPVGRRELLAALATARAAYAAGQVDGGAILAGRQFTIRQAFGCPGGRVGAVATATAADHGRASWTWGPDRKSIEISLKPAERKSAPILADETAWEAVEGYWLPWPWLQTEECPVSRYSGPAPPAAEASTPPGAKSVPPPTLLVSGLAAVFAQGSSRVSRRDGRPFALTLRGEAPRTAPANGYRLVIEGRFSAFSDGRAIRCRAADIDEPPVCIAAAEVDRVVFEDGDGTVLQEWRSG